MKLMLLIMPTIQRTVAAAAIGPPAKSRCRPRPNGKLTVDHGDAQGHGDAGQGELAEQLPAGPQLEEVVEEADADGQRRPAEKSARSDGVPTPAGSSTKSRPRTS